MRAVLTSWSRGRTPLLVGSLIAMGCFPSVGDLSGGVGDGGSPRSPKDATVDAPHRDATSDVAARMDTGRDAGSHDAETDVTDARAPRPDVVDAGVDAATTLDAGRDAAPIFVASVSGSINTPMTTDGVAIYFGTKAEPDTIYSMVLDGGALHTQGNTGPDDTYVVVGDGTNVYYVTGGSIYRQALGAATGSGVETIVHADGGLSNSLAVDGKYVYFTTAASGYVERASKLAPGPSTVLDQLAAVFGVLAGGDLVFFVFKSSGELVSLPADGGSALFFESGELGSEGNGQPIASNGYGVVWRTYSAGSGVSYSDPSLAWTTTRPLFPASDGGLEPPAVDVAIDETRAYVLTGETACDAGTGQLLERSLDAGPTKVLATNLYCPERVVAAGGKVYFAANRAPSGPLAIFVVDPR